MEKYISNSAAETVKIGEEFAGRLKPNDGVLYNGEIGAGKTYFTKGIARFFGIAEEVTSPTFALINEYCGNINIFHFDLYRINGFEELYGIGFFDYFDRNGILCVEWSENIPDLADSFENAYSVSIKKTGDESREIFIDKIK
ncbi:MAG: tRNA (adenosine(37)-N6)-threonylcarbamoyltransferase complex ATPase subunit type 1 TsaE [Firmicutes bacterium]|nr:tRNA (adenosine(37)-N6)-threonylcarbamoyltransferase complex ATPase subunit type 1 TsaE [[Eubacterium] siraeum]MCM1488077.1 tRNA (adenosine(37)-N6)-threonylcarbamoyltransferase complex ATPase subunit type 1 TsaE [Bacillota bacterium]